MDRELDGGSAPLTGATSAVGPAQARVLLPLVLRERESGPLREVRALWVTRWDYTRPDDVRDIIAKAAASHFNTVYFQVRGNADAFYESNIEPWAQRLTGTLGQDPGWDPLALAVQEAHQAGLELHAYVNVYPTWVGATPPPLVTPEPMYHTFQRLYGNEWVQWDESGNPMGLNPSYLWASPGHPAVSDHVVSVIKDIVTRYDVDGVHLDNVRYAGPAYSHDPVSEARFAADRAVYPDLSWSEWQRAQVSLLVGRVQSEACALRPGVSLSAAVWPVYRDRWTWWTGADGYDGYYQDSAGWLQTNRIDALCPMLYGSSVQDHEDRFVALLLDHVSRAAGKPVYAGISAGYTDFLSIARRIDLARTSGAQGQAIFSSRLVDQGDYWDDFAMGPYAQPAPIPTRVVRE